MRHSSLSSSSATDRIPYHKLPDLLGPSGSGRGLAGKSLLQSMRDYQGFWKPEDLRKRRPDRFAAGHRQAAPKPAQPKNDGDLGSESTESH